MEIGTVVDFIITKLSLFVFFCYAAKKINFLFNDVLNSKKNLINPACCELVRLIVCELIGNNVNVDL